MNRTIQSRITRVIITAIAFIALMGGLSLYYFSKLSNDIDLTIRNDILAERSAEKIKVMLIELKRLEKPYVDSVRQNDNSVDIQKTLSELKQAIISHQQYIVVASNQDRLSQLLKLQDDLGALIGQALASIRSLSEPEARNLISRLERITDEMYGLINEILRTRYELLEKHQTDIEILIANAHRNMIFFMFICASGGLVMVILAPSRVTAPIRRYIAAINEIEELKFDTRLPIVGDDEIGQLGSAINNLIDHFKTFDEIKQKRIQFEKSKQRVLANMLDQGVMMLSIEGEILFLNAQLAQILDLSTESYQGKDYPHVALPDELKEMIAEVLKKKERIDSRMMILHYKNKGEKEAHILEVLVDVGLVRNYKGNVVNIIITFEDITNPPGQSVFKRISIIEQELI